MVSPSLRFADEETETQTGRTRSLPGVPWPSKRKSQRKTFGALVFELKNLNCFLYGLRGLAEQMDVGVCANTRANTRAQGSRGAPPPPPQDNGSASPGGAWGPGTLCSQPGPGGATLLRVLREVAWRGEVGPPPPPSQVRSEDWGCGSRGRPDVMWACLAGLPAPQEGRTALCGHAGPSSPC